MNMKVNCVHSPFLVRLSNVSWVSTAGDIILGERKKKPSGLLELHYRDEVDAVMRRQTAAADIFHKSRSCCSDMTSGFQLWDKLSNAN